MIEDILDRDLIKKFRDISHQEKNLKNYESYYLAYIEFINENRFFFTDSILKKWGLDILISINPKEYIVLNPDIALQMETKRLSRGVYGNIDTLAMSIRDTLWDMVTIYSGKDCPITPNDELRYIKIKYADDSERLLLECAGCGWTEDVEGNEYEGPFGRVFPVNKDDLEKYIDL